MPDAHEARGLSKKVLKRIVGGLAVLPLLSIAGRALLGRLGANPIEAMENLTGWWALFMLFVTLACTPAQRIFGWNWPGKVRKLLGLSAFFYASAHFLIYLVFDNSFDWAAIWDDIVKRKFIFFGALALLVMIPLAITSRGTMIARLGPVRWKRLHRLTYVAAIAAVVHFVWRVKADLREPLIFAGVLAVLFAARVVFARKARAPAAQ